MNILALAAIGSAAASSQGSVPYSAETHVPVHSSGCGKNSPYTRGRTSVVQGKYAGVTWTYRVYVPKSYDQHKPMPVIVQHPGWGMTAKIEQNGCGITLYAENLGFISVTAQGGNDNPNPYGPWYSWNAAGTTQSPSSSAGPTCTRKASAPSYCYTSCPCTDEPQCDWATCLETGPTPTGTGKGPVGGFIPSLYDTLEEQLCIDTTREYAAGESNGGIMTYQLGVDLSSRLAAIAPQFGSFMRGFRAAPTTGVPVIDIHGSRDTTVPANVSLAGNGYYYTTNAEIFDGDQHSPGWKAANGCSGKSSHYPTKYDGFDKLWCVSEGSCSGGDVVRCSWNGGHNWYANSARKNGYLVTDFLTRWVKPSHIGKGYTVGEKLGPGRVLEDVVVLTEDTSPEVDFTDLPQTLVPASQGHYGDPAEGCRDDEDVIFAGTGRVCAPRIGIATPWTGVEPPTPKCKIGGVGPQANGCPVDAPILKGDAVRSWPICIAKGNTTDPYSDADFHCLLVCPCSGGDGGCGAEADRHCPGSSRCERGELLNRAHGVCTYHDGRAMPSPEEAVFVV